jgi:hypothetical protein
MRFTSLLRLPLFLALALPFGAHAGDDTKSIPRSGPTNAAYGSNYSKLENLFNTGLPPVFGNGPMMGFAGRCFLPTQDAAFKGSAYLVTSDTTQNGPIDCGRSSVMSVWNDDVDYFDHQSVGSVSQTGYWFPASIVNGSLVASLNQDTTSSLRMNGSYYVEKIANPYAPSAYAYCYYYQTLPR